MLLSACGLDLGEREKRISEDGGEGQGVHSDSFSAFYLAR